MILRITVDPEEIARLVNEVTDREEGDEGETAESVTRWIDDNLPPLSPLLRDAIVDTMTD